MAELGDDQVELSIDRSLDSDGLATISLSGELDSSNVGELDTTVSAILAERPDRVIFDLSRLRFIDSAGISILVRVAAEVGTLQIRDPTPIVRRVIEITGLTGILQVEP
jgi:anti-sigma B factor antagonist